MLLLLACGADGDGDGHDRWHDCDDGDRSVSLDAEEVCNGIDDDCDYYIDEGFDADANGIGDCLDTERCDGVDNNGDGAIDEDLDHDGDGITDCEDIEECDGFDNDGDGAVDERYADADEDGIADCHEACRVEPTETERCDIDLELGDVTCEDGRMASIRDSTNGLQLQLNTTDWISVRVDMTTGASSGWLWNLGDSESNDGSGGDGGTNYNDSEAQVKDAALGVYHSQELESAPAIEVPDAIDAAGDDLSILVCDGYFRFESSRGDWEVVASTLFQIDGDEPDSEAGENDRKLWLGIERSVANTTRTGTGVESATITFGR